MLLPWLTDCHCAASTCRAIFVVLAHIHRTPGVGVRNRGTSIEGVQWRAGYSAATVFRQIRSVSAYTQLTASQVREVTVVLPGKATFAAMFLVVLGAATLTTADAGSVASAQPGPPGHGDADDRAGTRAHGERVGELAVRLAGVESRVAQLRADIEARLEEANRARAHVEDARLAHVRARDSQHAAEADAEDATRRVAEQQRELDDFAARSYRQGRVLGSVSTYVGVRSLEEALEWTSLLDAVSRSHDEVLADLERTRAVRAGEHARAGEALRRALARRDAAEHARRVAETTEREAISARNREQQYVERIMEWKASAESDLAVARQRGDGPSRMTSMRAAAEFGTGTPSASPVVEQVVERALSQWGVPYAWGGGDTSGPTRGVRDGGVADGHGDHNKVGFDCSGLMIYAFAGVGIELEHYSGAQYQAGEHLPVSQARRGDMLFWESAGRTHHVALYLGDGVLVEAPYSGSRVRVAPVDHDGIAPRAVRLV